MFILAEERASVVSVPLSVGMLFVTTMDSLCGFLLFWYYWLISEKTISYKCGFCSGFNWMLHQQEKKNDGGCCCFETKKLLWVFKIIQSWTMWFSH